MLLIFFLDTCVRAILVPDDLPAGRYFTQKVEENGDTQIWSFEKVFIKY